MTIARSSIILSGTLLAVVLTVSSCSDGTSDTAPAPGTTSSVVASSTPRDASIESPTTNPATSTTSDSVPDATTGVAAPTSRTPEEVSDLWPWSQPRPSLDSGTVDPSLYETGPGLVNFTTPSGNVQCGIWAGGSPAGQVGCQAETSVEPFDGPVCTNAPNHKYAVRVDDVGAHHLCTTQGIYTSPTPRVLDHGQVLSTSGVVCSSDVDFGVTCWGTQGAFTFARDWNTTF